LNNNREVEKPKDRNRAVQSLHQTAATSCSRDLQILESQEKGAGKRDPAHRRDAEAGKAAALLWLPLSGPHLRLRSPEGFVEANVAFALWRSDMNENMAGRHPHAARRVEAVRASRRCLLASSAWLNVNMPVLARAVSVSRNTEPPYLVCWSMIFSENRIPLFGIML